MEFWWEVEMRQICGVILNDIYEFYFNQKATLKKKKNMVHMIALFTWWRVPEDMPLNWCQMSRQLWKTGVSSEFSFSVSILNLNQRALMRLH